MDVELDKMVKGEYEIESQISSLASHNHPIEKYTELVTRLNDLEAKRKVILLVKWLRI